MTGSERTRAALEGRWPDRRPVMLHNFMPAAREAGLTMKAFRSSPENAARAFIEAAERYDLDGVLVDIDTATVAGALGARVDLPEDEPARVSGPRLSSLDQARHLGPPPDLACDERIAIWVETCRLVKAHFGRDKFVRGNCDQAPFSLASMLRSPAEWMMDLAAASAGGPGGEGDGPVFALLEYCAGAALGFMRLVAATGVDMLSHGDSPAGPGLISPAMYRRYAAPFEKRLAEEAGRLGLPWLLHICGDTTAILADMAGTGADALELDSKTGLRAIHDVCASKLALFGTVDPVGVLRDGSPELAAARTRELLDVYRDSPRLVLNAGCALPPDTPAENIRSLVAAARA